MRQQLEANQGGLNQSDDRERAAGLLSSRLALSVRETASVLGVSEKTIRRLIDRRLLRVSRSLRHILIPRSEIERFLRVTLDVED